MKKNTIRNIIVRLVLIIICFFITGIFAQAAQIIKISPIPKAALLSPIGPMDPDAQMRLAIGLPGRNQAERDQLIQSIYDPNSPNYRHYLTPQDYAERFGATQVDYDAITAFFKGKGFKVTTSSNRLLLDVQGTVKMVEDTFHVTIKQYKHPTENRNFFAPDGNLVIDLDIPLETIAGLDNFTTICPAWGCKPPFRKLRN